MAEGRDRRLLGKIFSKGDSDSRRPLDVSRVKAANTEIVDDRTAIELREISTPLEAEVGEEQIMFSNLISFDRWQKSNPDAKILTREEGDKITPEDFPSRATIELTPADEKIKLTEGAVVERLEVLFGTFPQFAEDPAIVAQKIEAATIGGTDSKSSVPIYGQSNRRIPVDTQTMVKELEKLGFSFVTKDGAVAVLIEAEVPAQNNSNGRLYNKPVGSYRDPRFRDLMDPGKPATLDVSFTLPADTEKIGLEPVGSDTKSFFTISMEEIIRLHRENPGIENRYFGRDQAAKETSELITDEGSMNMVHTLRNLLKLEKIEGKTRQEKKVNLYNRILEIGYKPRLPNNSFYPKEPRFYLDDSGINKKNLADLQWEKGKSDKMFPTSLYLDDLLNIYEESHRS